MNWNRRTPKSSAGQRPLADAQLINRLAPAQGGVFSKADLQVTFADPHPASFGRRVRTLVAGGILTRFARNWYVAPGFDPATLSQRLAPISYVSFTTVLAEALLVGPAPERRITAVRVGRNRIYESGGYVVEHVGIAPHLFFGFGSRDGVCYADPEKAALDVLYFHLRGRRYPFDVYSDIDRAKLDNNRVRQYLSRYRNARFVAFAKQLLEIV